VRQWVAHSGLDPKQHLRVFYQLLLQRQKTKLHALIAVARKMLHGIYGMFRSRSPYDGSRLCPLLQPVALALTSAAKKRRVLPATLKRKILNTKRESSN
jgi:hypothetical protein